MGWDGPADVSLLRTELFMEMTSFSISRFGGDLDADGEDFGLQFFAWFRFRLCCVAALHTWHTPVYWCGLYFILSIRSYFSINSNRIVKVESNSQLLST